MDNTQQIILESLGERLTLANMDDKFVMTTMEMYSLNTFIKEDLYSDMSSSDINLKQQVDSIYYRIVKLNHDAWNGSFNNTNQLTYREYFKQFTKILEDAMVIKICVSESVDSIKDFRDTIKLLREAVS